MIYGYEPIKYYIDKNILNSNDDIRKNLLNLENFFDYQTDKNINVVNDVLDNPKILDEI